MLVKVPRKKTIRTDQNPQKSPVGNYRWMIVMLLFFATTINYLDRQVIGLLKDYLAADMNWSERDYSNIVMAFFCSLCVGLAVVWQIH